MGCFKKDEIIGKVYEKNGSKKQVYKQDHINNSKLHAYINSRKYRVENNYHGTLLQEENTPLDVPT